MMLANDLKTYYDEVRRYLDCPKDEQDRLLLSVNKQVIELQVDNPNLDYDGIVEFLGEPESLAASLNRVFISGCYSSISQKEEAETRKIGSLHCSSYRCVVPLICMCYSCKVSSRIYSK